MSNEQLKAISRRQLESYNESQEAARTVRQEVYAAECIFHFPGMPQPLDKAAHEGLVQMFGQSFTDDHFIVDDQVAEGDQVVNRFTWDFTHTGDFQGTPATGKRISVTGMLIHRYETDKIVEHRVLFDQLGMMQQLGVIPAPEGA